VSILLTVFGFGLKARADDLLYLFRRPGLLARSLLSMFVVMPVVAVLIARTFNLPAPVEIDLVALSVSAVPPLLPGKEGRAGGRTSYALGLLVTAAALSLVIVPAAIYGLQWYLGRPVAAPREVIRRVVVRTVLLPIVAGIGVRALLPAVAERIEKRVASIATLLLVVGALAVLVGSSRAIWTLVGNGTVLVMAIFVLAGLAAGHLLGGPEPDRSAVLALSTACRHPAMALALAEANRPELSFGAAILLYLIVSGLICLPYVRRQRRRIAAVPA
jgi:bile acid:Na+ symporter, BASS family